MELRRDAGIIPKHQIAGKYTTQRKLNFELGKNREQLTKLQMETAKTLRGDCIYSPEDLVKGIQIIKDRIREAET